MQNPSVTAREMVKRSRYDRWKRLCLLEGVSRALGGEGGR